MAETALQAAVMRDQDLVARVRNGDDAAFEEVVRRYRAPLHAFAARLMGGAAADADDVVQEALVRALRGMRSSDRPVALRPWLHMIVRNRAIDHLRVRRPAEGPEALALVPAPGPEPGDAVVAGEAFAEVMAAIAALPERQRRAFVHRELGGSSHLELARELGTTVPGAKSLLVRARTTVARSIAAAA